MKRCEIDDKYKWDLKDLFSSFDNYEKELDKVKPIVLELKKYKGHILDNSDNLYKYLELDKKASYILERLHFYAFLVIDEDVTDSDAQKYLNMVEDAITKYNSEITFFEPELLKSDYSVIEKFISEDDRLKEYERLLKNVYRLKDHMLSEKEEIMINEMDNIAQSFDRSSRLIRTSEIEMGSIEDEEGNVIKLLPSNIRRYALSENREVRKQAFLQESEAYEKRINSLAANYIGYVKTYETEAKFRGYKNALEQKLDTMELSEKVYDSLKETVLNSIPVYQKYLKLIKDTLGFENLESYDLNAPLIKKSEKEYSIEEAKEIILNVFDFYGEEYKNILNFAFDKRCIDFLPNENKVSMWYSAYIPYAYPRILANYEKKIMDISALSHELGHFVNQYKIIETQASQNVYQSTFCAEVSSLNNEIVFSNKMQEMVDDIETKKELLANFIKTFASNFFGAMRQALFEEEAHEKIAEGTISSASDLCNIWLNINSKFNGDMLISTKGIGWAAISHYYLNRGYYVFNYSTGIVAACNLANKLLLDEEDIKEKFMNYLTIGNSLAPIESLKTLDIDMTTKKPYEVAIEMFSKAIDEFYKLNNM